MKCFRPCVLALILAVVGCKSQSHVVTSFDACNGVLEVFDTIKLNAIELGKAIDIAKCRPSYVDLMIDSGVIVASRHFVAKVDVHDTTNKVSESLPQREVVPTIYSHSSQAYNNNSKLVNLVVFLAIALAIMVIIKEARRLLHD